MNSWIDDVNAELERARKKFPKPDFLLTAFSEESGELVKSVLDNMFGKSTESDVYSEAIQVIAMAVRLIEEGDPIHKLSPLTPSNEEDQTSAHDQWLSANYFCVANLRTNKNPRIDLMLNCKDFWFEHEGLLVRVNRRLFPNAIREGATPTPDGYYYIHTKDLNSVLAEFFQQLIVKYHLQDAWEVVDHFNAYYSDIFANMKVEVNGRNYIRARRINTSNNII